MQTPDVRETAAQAVHQSKSFLGKQLDERSTQLGQQIGGVAQDLRTVRDQLRDQGLPSAAATYVDRGAQMVDGIGAYLRDADSEKMIADLETAARRQPWAVAAGALVLGFAASRFLKTSSSRRFDAGATRASYPSQYSSGVTSYAGRTAYGDRAGDAYESGVGYDAP